jgi:FkbM family methyltransferase
MAVASAIMPKGLVLDVGAHDGADAISFAKFGHHVLSFEPNIQKRSMVLNNLRKANLTSKTLLHINFLSAAVGDQEGEQTFYADVAGKNKGGSEMDSLSPLYNNGSHTNRTTVKVTTIDAAVGARNVIFAKIDAQGWDGKVVLGARQTIRDGRLPILTMEVTPRLAPNGFASYMHSFELLARHGYRCFDCDTSKAAQMPFMTSVPFPKVGHYRAVSRQGTYTTIVSLHGRTSTRVAGQTSSAPPKCACGARRLLSQRMMFLLKLLCLDSSQLIPCIKVKEDWQH